MQLPSRHSTTLWWLLAAAPAALAQDGPAHWAWSPPLAVDPPAVANPAWPRNELDAFVLAGIERAGRQPSPPADATTLARRLCFDLVGLPPDAADVEAIASGAAYEGLVDRLLASPHFAERMAMHWLDLVRFADTTGVHADNPWDIYPYRDWVISAFDDNMPFDRFTREQIAGDLLPDATQSQRVAAAYNRLNLITREGGSQPKEFLARYTADRVRNLSTVWLAATVGCAECHDHKFDPIAARDFYRIGAFFADIEQVGVYSQGAEKGRYFGPYLSVPTAEQQATLAEIDGRIASARSELGTPTDALRAAQLTWEREVIAAPPLPPEVGIWHAAGPYRGDDLTQVHRRAFGPEQGVDLAVQHDGRPRWIAHPEWVDGKAHKLSGDRSAYYLFRTITVVRAQQLTLHFGSDDSIRVWVDGEQRLDREVSRGVAPDQERLDLDLAAGRHELLVKISNGSGGFAFYFRPEFTSIPDAVLAQLEVPADQRTAAGSAAVTTHFRGITPLLAAARARLRALQDERTAFVDALPVVMATVATEPMTTRVLRRGDWMDDSGEVVQPGVPAAFGALPPLQRRATRLDLADWLVAENNPLVARVFVNRLWRLFFGRGIVRSPDDFGTQGERPTHPELLDWLARRFVRSGWDVKAMVRLMVTSATYRQSSRCDPETARLDPYNEWFSRQARYRHDAEIVRDNALAVSGLLVTKVGGRSVRPYQPEGFYRHLNFPQRSYEQDQGDNLWRRSIYTHWQRQYLHPSLAAFDAPSREQCTVQRSRSNTPLQALVLLNDPIFVEAARALGTRMVREGGPGMRGRAAFAFEAVLSRPPTRPELDVLLEQHDRLRRQYTNDPQAADALLAIGEHALPVDVDRVELAALTGVARVLLSLHETLTRVLMPIMDAFAARTRRAFLSTGLGAIAAHQLLAGRQLLGTPTGPTGTRWNGVVDPRHHAPRAKRVIHLYMAGGPSHLETLDYKPKLAELDGQPMPPSFTQGQPIAQLQGSRLVCLAPQFPFARFGESGQQICTRFPHIGSIADDISIIRSMQTDQINHDPAHTLFNTGSTVPGRPSMGSWINYGLGSECDDLPGFVVLASVGKGGQAQPIAARQWSAGFLPSRFQGVEFRGQGDPVLYVQNPAGVTRQQQREAVDAISRLNRLHEGVVGDPEIATRIAQFEMAYRMQASVPELADLSNEPASVLDLYGVSGQDGSFASNCLLARRLAERGVRFIQVYHRAWDHHGGVKRAIEITADEVDRATAALITDLKRRGMLDDTLVLWGGEFGRTPMAQGNGRDHHIRGYSYFLAGGGISGGTCHGATDELGYHAVEDIVHVRDLQATILHLLGIDHLRLSQRFQGLDVRLTGVETARPIRPIIA